MEEFASQFMPKLKFLSLIRADITYLQDEKQFYFDKVVQPIFHCFGCSEAKIVLELDHLIDFMLKDDKVIHEARPEGKIVGGNVVEFDNSPAKELEKGEENAIEASSAEEATVPTVAPVETGAPAESTNE